MRLLYVALDQHVPGTLGGSIHVQAVAEGLARLGHEVHVAAQDDERLGSRFDPSSDSWKTKPESFLSPSTRCRPRSAARSCAGRAAGRSRGSRARSAPTSSSSGTTTSAARASSRPSDWACPAVLEVNAPVVDYPGSDKARLDRVLGRRADAALARSHLPVDGSLRHAERRDPADLGRSRTRPRDRMGRRRRSLPAGRRRSAAVPARSASRALRIFAGAFRAVARRRASSRPRSPGSPRPATRDSAP